MGYFEGLLGGFMDRKREVEQENLKQAALSADREGKIFQALLASDDPEIQSLAMTGLLDSANPKKRKGGLRGWVGEVEQSPYLAQIQQLIRTPVQATPPGLPSTQTAQGVGLAPNVQPSLLEAPDAAGGQAAALPTTSPLATQTTPSTPPPRPTSVRTTQAPPTPATYKPRQVFMDPMEKYRQQQILKAQGDVQGEIAGMVAGGFTQPEALDLYRRKTERARGVAGNTYAEGEVTPDPASPTGFSQTLYLRSDPTKTLRMPAMDPSKESSKTSTRFFGQDLESISQSSEFGGLPFALQPPDVKARIVEAKRQADVAQAGAVTTARGAAQAAAPMDRQQTFAAHQTLTNDWQELAKPLREVQRQMLIMDAGMAAARRGDMAAGTDAVQLTFQKILDPISVVRTEEYLRIVGEQSLIDRARGAWERMKAGGTGVPLSELAEYAALAKQIASAMDRGMQIDRVRIARTARSFGLDPSLILDRVPSEDQAPASTSLSTPAATAPPRPQTAAPAAPAGQLHQDANGNWVF